MRTLHEGDVWKRKTCLDHRADQISNYAIMSSRYESPGSKISLSSLSLICYQASARKLYTRQDYLSTTGHDMRRACTCTCTCTTAVDLNITLAFLL